MDMKTYLKQASPDEREALALAVGSSVGYFYLIAGGHRKAGTDLCKALVAAEPKLTLCGLRPDVWDEQADTPQSPQSIAAAEKKRNGGVRLPLNPDRLK
jgi:hypothetical protein